jgi:phosphohistidine phosphatase SixA
MDLILWRHAEAEDANPKGDLARNLTKHGRKQAERMAQWLKERLDGEWRVVASPAARTLQTVEPLGVAFDVSEALAPGASPRAVLREAGWPSAKRSVIVVGHQPTLGEVAAELLQKGDGDMSMRKGAVWWFSTRQRDGRQETVLKAVVDPEMAAGH